MEYEILKNKLLNELYNDLSIENVNLIISMAIGAGFNLGKEHPSTKHKKKPVIQSEKNGKFIKVFRSVSEASNLLGIDKTNISRVCLEKQITAKGFKFRFLNVNDYYKYRHYEKYY